MKLEIILNLIISIMWVIIPVIFYNYLIKHTEIEKYQITKGMKYSVLAFFVQLSVSFLSATFGIMSGSFMMPFIVLLGSIFALYLGEKLKVTGTLKLEKNPRFYTILGFGAGFGGIFVIINGLMNFIVSLLTLAGFSPDGMIQQVIAMSIFPYDLNFMSLVMVIYNIASVVYNMFLPIALTLYLMKGYYYKTLFSSIAFAVFIEILIGNLVAASSIFGAILGIVVMVGATIYICKSYIPSMKVFFNKLHELEEHEEEIL